MSVTPSANGGLLVPQGPSTAGGVASNAFTEWQSVSRDLFTKVDNNSVLNNGTFASGSFTTNLVTSDPTSGTGDPLRWYYAIDLTSLGGLTAVQSLQIYIDGVSFTNATDRGIVFGWLDGIGGGASSDGYFFYRTASGTATRIATAAAWGFAGLVNPAVTVDSLIGDVVVVQDSVGNEKIARGLLTPYNSSVQTSNFAQNTASNTWTPSSDVVYLTVLVSQDNTAAVSFDVGNIAWRAIPMYTP